MKIGVNHYQKLIRATKWIRIGNGASTEESNPGIHITKVAYCHYTIEAKEINGASLLNRTGSSPSSGARTHQLYERSIIGPRYRNRICVTHLSSAGLTTRRTWSELMIYLYSRLNEFASFTIFFWKSYTNL
jgi:hypothetical protein